jgi:hypothetical protein
MGSAEVMKNLARLTNCIAQTESDGITSYCPEGLCGIFPVHAHFQIAGASGVGKCQTLRRLTEALAKFIDLALPYAEREASGRRVKVRNHIPEPIDAEDLASPEAWFQFDGLKIGKPLDVFEKRANVLRPGDSAGERGCDGSENIASVKGTGWARKPKFTVRDFASRAAAVSREQQTEHAVIGSNEKLFPEFDEQRFAIGADAGIDDHDMNRAGREERRRLVNSISAGVEREGWNAVRDVYYLGLWTTAQDHALHSSGILILQSKVCCQSNNGTRHALLRL